MSSALAVSNGIGSSTSSIMDQVITKGNLAELSPDQRARYYAEVCHSLGVNPLTKPFDYISLNNKLTLYATKTATDQLRKINGVSIFRVEAETTPDGLRIVTAYARDVSGREDMDVGAVFIKGLTGEALANAQMKALTKAKRRVTLSICGLGWLDESEVDSVPSARFVRVDTETGEIIEPVVNASRTSESDVSAPQETATPRQLKYVDVLAREKGITPEQLDGECELLYGAPLTQLGRRDVSNLIDYLQTGAPLESRAAVPEPTDADTKVDDDEPVPPEIVENIYPMTDVQVRRLYALRDDLGWTDKELKVFAGVNSSKELDSLAGQIVINKMVALLEAKIDAATGLQSPLTDLTKNPDRYTR